MPLPKSLLCTSCKRTYPEGWKRCPYCGYDEQRARKEAEGARAAARKRGEPEPRAAGERAEKARGRSRRGGSRPQQRQTSRGENRPQTPGPPREPGPVQQGAQPQAEQQRPPALPGEAQRRRRRRRGRGRRGTSEADAGRSAAAPPAESANGPQINREPRPGPPRAEGAEVQKSEGQKKRRRRFRRRRGGRTPEGGGTPSAPQ